MNEERPAVGRIVQLTKRSPEGVAMKLSVSHAELMAKNATLTKLYLHEQKQSDQLRDQVAELERLLEARREHCRRHHGCYISESSCP